MLNWSITKYKFTLGLGGLGIGALLTNLWKPIFPPLIAVEIAIIPFVLFAMLDPGDFPDAVVRTCQFFGSAWYLAWVLVLAIGLALEPNPPPDGWFLASLCIPGLIPTISVLRQTVRMGFCRKQETQVSVNAQAESSGRQ